MINAPFQDPRASDLLSRVGDDVSLLRQDVANLISHTARHTLPGGARDLADNAKLRLSAGKDLTARQLRVLRDQMNRPSTAWAGGALVIGLIAAGVYLFCKSDCCGTACDDGEDEEI